MIFLLAMLSSSSLQVSKQVSEICSRFSHTSGICVDKLKFFNSKQDQESRWAFPTVERPFVGSVSCFFYIFSVVTFVGHCPSEYERRYLKNSIFYN